MYFLRLGAFEEEVAVLHPGEFFATRENLVVSTVLGSCVAVALYDAEGRGGGMNHFLLAERVDRSRIVQSEAAKYGMYAMELLVNELLKLGIDKRSLRAKVFGGASVLRLGEGAERSVPRSNVDFAFEYLSREDIPVVAADVGGRSARKVFLFARGGKVLLKRVSKDEARPVEREEGNYLRSLRLHPPEGKVVLFKGSAGGPEEPERG